MYIIRGGFLDGLPGLQVSMLMSFFNTYFKQAKLWQMERALLRPDVEGELEKGHLDVPCTRSLRNSSEIVHP